MSAKRNRPEVPASGPAESVLATDTRHDSAPSAPERKAPIFSADGKEPWDLNDAAWFKKHESRFYRRREAFPGEPGNHAVVHYWGPQSFRRFTGDFAAVPDSENAAKALFILLEDGGTEKDMTMFAKHSPTQLGGPQSMAATILKFKGKDGESRLFENSLGHLQVSGLILEAHDFPDEKTIPKWDFLYGRHLLRKTVSGTAAMGSTGKSSMSLVEALAMVTGKPLLGEEVPKTPLRVLLICLEDNRNAMDKRIAAAMKAHKLTPQDIGGRLFIKAKGEIKFKIANLVRGSVQPNDELINQIINALRDYAIDVFSIDPFIKTHSVPENDNSGISDVVECYDEIAEQANCAVSLWHHTRKGNNLGQTTVDSARGASSFIDACRSVRVLETMTEAEAQKQKIEHYRRYFRAFSGKLNFAPSTDKSTWYQITSVPILNGSLPHFKVDGGNGGDNVGVVEAWELPSTSEVELTAKHITTIKTAIGQGEWREDMRAVMWVGKALAPILDLDPEDDKPKLQKLVKKLISEHVLKLIPGKTATRHPCLFVVNADEIARVNDVKRKKTRPK